jgi:Kelch motif/Bacterial Ig-like domain (group 2)
MTMNFRIGPVIVASLLIAATGCGGGGSGTSAPPPPPTGKTYTASGGVAQKGPLILGSTVTAQELTATLVPNGKQYSYQTNSDLGTFNPNSAFTSPYIGISATGYYFDEVTNALSGGTITLNAYGDLGANPALNVNLLTTLAYQRIETLVKAGSTFTAAEAQAEREVLAGLGIVGVNSDIHFGTLDLSKGTTGDKLLAAVSSLFVNGNSSANLAALIANFQNDLSADGIVSSTSVRDTLLVSARSMNPAAVAANLNQKYAAQSVSYSAADISGWLDQDGDGLVGQFEYSVADATQTTAFPIPAAIVTANVGQSVSATNGVLTVNGTVATSPRQLAAGDVLTVSPPAGVFPNGMQLTYLNAGANKIARVSFVSGLASIEVTPGDVSVPKGLHVAFTAVGHYTDGGVSDISGAVSWSSDVPAVVSVATNSGVATGNGVGTATISANLGLITGSTTLHVVTPTLMSITIEPAAVSVVAGRTKAVEAVGTYSDGTTMDVSSLATWDVGSPLIATVSGGLVSGVAVGGTTLRANIGTISTNGTIDTVSQEWAATASMRQARRSHTATLLNDGRVLVSGGTVTGGNATASAEIFDPATESWSPAADMNAARYYGASIRLASGKVLVVGGDYFIDPSLRAEVYDPAINTWTPAGPMLAPRTTQTLTLLPDGRVLAVGFSPASPVDAEIYDPLTNVWTAAAALHHPRSAHTATLLPNGTVLVCGGSPPDVRGAEPVSEIFDPTTGNWSDAGTMTNPEWTSASVLLPNGKVLVTGGALPFPQAFTTTEIFDPATSTWTLAANTARVRELHTALLLPNGQVLVAGGLYDIAPAYRISEIYDVTANRWADTVPMISGRVYGTVTLLDNGKVLAVGGSLERGSEILATAELFDYAGNPN